MDSEAPFYEPGLRELIQAAGPGRLRATTSMEEGLQDAGIALICVGTPSERNGNLNLEQLVRVCLEIRPLLEARRDPLILAIRSTVFPGTCEDVILELLGHHPAVRLVSNPEFLREGTAIQDFLDPSLMVVGSDSREAAEQVASLYAPLGLAPCLVSLRTAEMIKYACNAFHAVKICFANEIGTLASKVGVDAGEVMRTLCRDSRLNVSAAYLTPGFAFGGSCLPKDLRALVFRTSRLDLELPLLESVLKSNDRHLERSIRKAQSLPASRVGVFGLAFKENTDDLRESPAVQLLEQMLAKGREVRVFDPHIRMNKLYGSNLNFLLTSLPHVGRLLTDSLEDLLSWSERLVLVQKPAREDAARIAASGLPVLDVTRIEPEA